MLQVLKDGGGARVAMFCGGGDQAIEDGGQFWADGMGQGWLPNPTIFAAVEEVEGR